MKRRTRGEGIRGELQVLWCSPSVDLSLFMNFSIVGVAQAPGLPPFPATLTGTTRGAAKWPSRGESLPVAIHPNPADPTVADLVEILWEEVPTQQERALAEAQQLAAQLRAEL